jgi:Tfp pilus assembly PilM family ATPase
MAKAEIRFKPRPDCVVMQSGDGWVRAVRFHGGRHLTIARMGVHRVSSGAEYEQLARELFRKGKFGSHPVIGCLPRSDANVRLLELPSTSASEISDMVELQVGRLTPYSREEVDSQYRRLGLTRGDSYTKLMLSIVQRSVVRDHYCHLEATGHGIERMSVSTEGLLNWALHTCVTAAEEEPVAILDVDAESSELLVIRQHVLVFSKCIRLGARQLAEDPEATLTRLTNELHQALDVYQAESGGHTVSRLVTTGANRAAQQVSDAMTGQADLTCEVIDALKDVQMGKGCTLTDEVRDGCSLASLVGIACYPDAVVLDFEPEVVRMRRFMVARANECTRIAALITLVLSLSVVYLMLAYGFRYREWVGYETRNAETGKQVDELLQKVDQTREANQRLNMRLSPVNLLHALEQSAVEGVAVEQLDYAADLRRVTLKGSANRRMTISTFVGNLSTNTYFWRVEDRGDSVQRQDGRYAFELLCDLGDGS